MKILFLGDIVGRSGRDAVCAFIPKARKEYALDFVVVNGENAAAGFGITPAICDEFIKAGVDVITTGNHAWDQQEIIPKMAKEKRLLRPENYPEGTVGSGVYLAQNSKGQRLLVLHLQGQLFMHEHLSCPFASAENTLKTYAMKGNVDAILVDMHAEATSEKNALGHYLDGRVSLVIGTHTHIPTADARILPGGTAFQTDAGMCGDYDSIIGMEKAVPIKRFTTKISKGSKMTVASGEATLCGAIVETDDKTGLAISMTSLRIGGILNRFLGG